jgi:ubiquinone/menaquinone biosynthesis C-methylase UbiE
LEKKPIPGFQDFRDVDREARPESFVKYLDTVTGLEAVRGYKQRSYDLLRLKPGSEVLDVGCGTGEDVCEMARRIQPSGRVVGIDNSEVMITEARKRSKDFGLPVEFHTGDAHKLKFGDNLFDATRAERIFQHLKDPDAALKEMIRVTRPNGMIGVVDPDWGSLLIDSSDRDLTRKIFATSENDSPRNPWMGRQLYSLFAQSGIENLQVLAINVPMISLSVAEQVLTLHGYMRRAIEKHVISKNESDRWFRELEERDRAGRFFSSLSGFGLFGTKPSQSSGKP